MKQGARFRFGVFEVDGVTGELRRKGIRVRLAAQPLEVLLMLLQRPGELLTREEIAERLWPDGTFVDYDNGLNSAVNRIREAIGDTAANPRFLETLARRGYRFVAPVETVLAEKPDASGTDSVAEAMNPEIESSVAAKPTAQRTVLATAEELPRDSHALARALFLLLQGMYLFFYVSVLFNLPEVNELLSTLPHPEVWFGATVVSAAVLLPARAYLLSAILFRAPGIGKRYLKLWPLLLALDAFWALSPFLLMHHVAFGVALACTALLMYSPFAQRSLMLMGAGDAGGVQPEA